MGGSHRGVTMGYRFQRSPEIMAAWALVNIIPFHILPIATRWQHFAGILCPYVGCCIFERRISCEERHCVRAFLCGCVFVLSLFVCLCVYSCPVRSFVAAAINSPQSSAPVVHSFADIRGLSLVYMPTLHVGEKY